MFEQSSQIRWAIKVLNTAPYTIDIHISQKDDIMVHTGGHIVSILKVLERSQKKIKWYQKCLFYWLVLQGGHLLVERQDENLTKFG